ncbi:MAG TPA: NIPSNAP family protein [Opitutaceae bacterium]
MKNLNRRDFLKTSLAASAALAAMPAPARAAGTPDAGGQVIELRAYRLRAGAPHVLLDGYLEKAFIPALNARGIEAVGVFTEPDAKDGAVVWVLIPHPTIESAGTIDGSLNADPQVQAAGMDYLSSPTKDAPAFDRIDSWLFRPFSGLPRLAVPELARGGKPRIFEMRTYESYSELKALNKVAMFNAGEIDAMKEVHLSPVFYGQALLGRDLPHLTYMLCSPDMETHKRNWNEGFAKHPVWLKLKADPQYADNVSKITSRFLVPAAYSQI